MNIGIPEQTHLFHKLFKVSASWRRQQWRIHTTQRTPKRTSTDTVTVCATGARVTVQMTHYVYIMPKAPKYAENMPEPSKHDYSLSGRPPNNIVMPAEYRPQSELMRQRSRLCICLLIPPPHPCVCNGVIFIQYFRDRHTHRSVSGISKGCPSILSLPPPPCSSSTGHLLLDPYPHSLSLSVFFCLSLGSTVYDWIHQEWPMYPCFIIIYGHLWPHFFMEIWPWKTTFLYYYFGSCWNESDRTGFTLVTSLRTKRTKLDHLYPFMDELAGRKDWTKIQHVCCELTV